MGKKDPSIWEGYTAVERRSHSLIVVIMVWGFIDAVATLLELSVMSVKNNCSEMHVIDFLGVSDLDDGCENGAIRLADGNTTAGRVDLCSNGVWAHVCHQSWDTNDARVACRELGLPSACMQYI